VLGQPKTVTTTKGKRRRVSVIKNVEIVRQHQGTGSSKQRSTQWERG
jgi:hypothetical protein